MASVNKCILIGNLGRDPELRYNPNGVAFCTISLATTRSWKSRETNERVEETEWHRVVFNDKLAEIVGEYTKKGRSLYIEGRLRTRKWTDKEGKEQYTTEVVADQMQLLGGRDDGQGGNGGQGGGGEPRGRAPAPAPRPAESRAPAPAPRASTGFDSMDDDIPFENVR